MSLSRLFLPIWRDLKSTNEMVTALDVALREQYELIPLTRFQQLLYRFRTEDTMNNVKIIIKILRTIKEMLYGSITVEPESDNTTFHLVSELINRNLLVLLVDKLPEMPVEGRNDITLIFDYVIGQQVGTQLITVNHIRQNPSILQRLINYYSDPELVPYVGQILRGFLRFECLTKQLFGRQTDDRKLQTKYYLQFFDLILQTDLFVVSSDVFLTLHELFARFKTMAKVSVQTDSDVVIRKLNQLLTSDDYSIKRETISLVKDLLYDRSHQTVMKLYIKSVDNLKIVDTLMKSDCCYTAIDGFIVFYLFVANPDKDPIVEKYLADNKKLYYQTIDKLFDSNKLKVIGKRYASLKDNIYKRFKGEKIVAKDDKEDEDETLIKNN